MQVIKTLDEADKAWATLSPDERSDVEASLSQGVTPQHAINLVRSKRAQDTARTSVEADGLTREPTTAEHRAAAGMGVANAFTLGGADEARGALAAVGPLLLGAAAPLAVDHPISGMADRYRTARDDARVYSKDQLAGSFGAGDLAGNAVTAALNSAAGAAGAGTGFVGNAVSQGMKLGALTGGESGFGHGEGAADSIKQGLLGAGEGAAVGGALGKLGDLGGLISKVEPEPSNALPLPKSKSAGAQTVDVLEKLQSLPAPVKAIAKHIPLVGKAMKIADDPAVLAALRGTGLVDAPDFGIPQDVALDEGAPLELAREPPSKPKPSGVTDALDLLKARMAAQDAAANPFSAQNAAPPDVVAARMQPPASTTAPVAPADEMSPSMMVESQAKPSPTSSDWTATPEQLAAGDVTPAALADIQRLEASVKGGGTTPPPSTANDRLGALAKLKVPEQAPASPDIGPDVEALPVRAELAAERPIAAPREGNAIVKTVAAFVRRNPRATPPEIAKATKLKLADVRMALMNLPLR